MNTKPEYDPEKAVVLINWKHFSGFQDDVDTDLERNIMKLKDNIVESWLAVLKTQGKTQAEGLREMNQAVGRSYGSNRISEWRQGIKQPGYAAVRYMMRYVIVDVLLRAGMGPRSLKQMNLDGLVDALSVG